MSMPERDTMRLRNKKLFGTMFFVLLGATSFWGTQGQTTTPQQNQQRVQATPVPADIDPSDPALPTWAKPAAPAPGAANTATPTTPANVPSGQQPQQQPGGSQVGTVTRNGDQFTIRSQ